MREVRLGIIGVGAFGQFTLEIYRALPGVRITAIAGTRAEKYAALARQYGIPFHTTDWQALATHPEVDVVYVATPPHTRAAMALAAVQAGKHVFCEKPLALTLAEADALLAAAEAAGVRAGINFVMRYARLYEVLAAIVREDLLGDPVYFTFHNAAGDLAPDHWFWDPARSGGILVEHGVHFFDLFAAIFGPGRVQTALVGRRVNRAEDRWQCLLLYHKQLFGDFLHAFAKAPPVEHTRAAVEFALGTVTLDGWIPTRLSLDGLATDTSRDRLAAVLPGAVVTPLEAPCPVPAVGREHTVTAHVSGGVDLGDKQAIYADACRDALADFLAWVRDRAHRPRVTAVDGRAALATALEATALARRTAAG